MLMVVLRVPRSRGTLVPRYFFKIQVSGGEPEDDPHGTNLPNVAAALSYARRTITELLTESGYDEPNLMMIVEDEARQTVLALPFAPGRA
jgi:hypothetical protein